MAQAAAVKTKPAPAPAPRQVPLLRWSGKTKTGDVRSGEMEAQDAAAVEARLRQMGIEPTKVKKKPKELHIKLPGVGGVTNKDILVFTRQFSVMIDAGLPLVQALDILGSQSDNPAFKKVLLQVKGRVEAGSTFADALAEHPKVFDELFVQLTRAGEIGGILDTILQRLGAYIEKNEKLARRVKGAMVYPAVVLVIAVGVLVVLLAFVTPTFEKMFKDFGGSMPAATQFMIDLSHGLRDYWYWYVAVPTVFTVAFKLFKQNPRGRELWDAFVL